jgi:murein L,D-transpeptidase YcbB/YkuD
MPRAIVGRVLPFAALIVSTSCGWLHVGGADGRPAGGAQPDALLRQAIQSTRQPAFVSGDSEGTRLWQQTRRFYENRAFAPAWIEGRSPSSHMDALIGSLRAADREGIDPDLYGIDVLEQRRKTAASGFLSRKGFDPQQAAAMDTWLTYLYLKYASDLADGLSDLAHADPVWQIDTEPFDALAHLEQALHDHRIAESLTALTPTDEEYTGLRKALADYRAIAARGGWPTLPASLKLKPGQSSPVLHALALRLAASGDFQREVRADDKTAVYDADLENALKRFQRRHGLSDDGVIGRSVVAELNVPVDARVRQIQLNMERWRWLPRDLGDPHILVNIPQMRLDVREHGQVPLSMRVVVGKEDTPTPIFNQRMTYLVFAPYWNIPADIAQHETLPSVLKESGFLARAGMEVIDASGKTVDPDGVDLEQPGRYRFRQRPGTSNSLGQVKFMFPNQFNVYLHDTPADSLFARASRSLSHGCVRLEAPAKLAAYVLRDQPEWTEERIARAMEGTDEQIVKLKVPVPVYLGYWTARVARDGSVEFRKDVYSIDRRQTIRLAERLERLRHSSTAAAAAESFAAPALATR